MLYLLPNLLDETQQDHRLFFPSSVEEAMSRIDGLIAESEKSARYYLKRFSLKEGKSFREIPLKVLNEHTSQPELQELLAPLEQGECWGLISDCGLPCIADPGASLVALANKKGIAVETFSGPSSLIMALQLSGIFSQKFFFQGYLPREEPLLLKQLTKMQKEVLEDKATQVFIEAPYRNQKLLQALIQHMSPQLRLCVAVDLTMPSQEVKTLTIKEWKNKDLAAFQKRAAIFVLGI